MAKKSRRAASHLGSGHLASSNLASRSLEQTLQQITQLGKSGNLSTAAAKCQQILKQHPDVAQAWYLMSMICLQQKQAPEALAHIQRAIDLDAANAEFYSQAGVIHCHLGALATGIDCYQKALALQPQLDHTRFNLGFALQKMERLAEAATVYLELIGHQPHYPMAYQQLGNVYQQLEQFSTAISYYQKAVQQQPQLAPAWCNLGVALQNIGETQQAQQAFQRALAIAPAYVEAHNGLGACYEKQELASQAIYHYQQALATQPDYIPALVNLGNVQLRLEQFSEAETIYQRTLQLQPNNTQILDDYIKLLSTTCCWPKLTILFKNLQNSIRSKIQENVFVDVSPLNSLYLPFSAKEQQLIAENHAAAIERRMAEVKQQFEQEQQFRLEEAKNRKEENISRIRLGYVSGDFRYHAVGQLILQLFERHDRRSFEVFAYSLGPDDHSLERKKLINDCDCFRDVKDNTPIEIARQISQDRIDILIDLSGYTNYACPELFALRPAALQVNYLGYPATLGATYIDYIITDPIITPPELIDTLTEHCIYLPETYQVNCYPYPETEPDQKDDLDYTLPADAFVFCCFNKSQKIESTVFATWMRILTQVPKSVLWLLSDHPDTEQNLRSQAVAHGVAAERLIFAPRVSKATHLKRHQQADLFLDTPFYNAHVTASDSLWAGTPLITLLGDTFASRVAASLLTAAGIPELITRSLAEYERLAIHLATHPAELQQIKDRLLANQLFCSLFDSSRTIRHLEAAYQLIWQRQQAGLSPEAIWVPYIDVENSGGKAKKENRKSKKINQNSKSSANKPQQNPISTLSDEAITCTASSGFLDWLSQANGSLLITTYQAGKVLLVGWNGQQVTLLARQFQKPMGVAVAGDRIALSTRHELTFFANARSLAYSYLEEQPGRYDALYLPRSSYFTGDLHTHDLAFGQDGLWLVNTRFSCLASLSLDFNFVPRWYPAFISELVPEDRCHLNGLAMVAGKPKYVTALGATDQVGGWRATKATGGIVIDVETDEIVLRGLSMPHSPRWYQDKLWLLNSGTGELWRIDPTTWKHEVVCALPGFGRGLTLLGNYALIGLCQSRETHIFGELPLQERFEQLICGVAVVDLQQGSLVGLLEFPTGCRELYDVKFLPGILRPNLLNSDKEAVREAFIAPEFAYWLRSSTLAENNS